MANWRTNEIFDGVADIAKRRQQQFCNGKKFVFSIPIVSSGSKYPIYDAWTDFLKNGGHVDYPGGLEQFEKDAMREKAQMLQDSTNTEKGVE